MSNETELIGSTAECVSAEEIAEAQPASGAAALTVVAKPHPLSGDLVMAEYPVGSTLAEIVGPDAICCRVEIAGQEIAPEWWPRIRPKINTPVLITRFPQGHMGVKDILRLVAFAALAVVTYGVASGVIFGSLSAMAAMGVAAGIGIAGSLLIAALIPPSKPNAPVNTALTTLQGITGTQNQANPYGAIPCVIGTMRFFPPLAALPFSELNGNDQYVRFLFDIGYGTPAVSVLKIGENDLANFTDVETQIGNPRNLIPDSDGTFGTWSGNTGLVFASSGGAVAGGKWTYTGTGAASTFRFRQSSIIPVTPGQVLTISGYIDATNIVAPGVGQGLPFWGVWNTARTINYAGAFQSVGANGRVSATFTVPGGVTSVVVTMETDNVTVTSAHALVFSDPQLELGSTLTDYQSTVVNIFTSDVTETAAGDVLNTDGNSAVRTSAINADELGIDVVFPSGLFGVDSKGKAINVSCDIRVETTQTGLGAYSAVPSLPGGVAGVGLTISNPAAVTVVDIFRVTSSERKTLRIGFRWKCNSGFGRTQYDIRVTRVSTNWGTADPSSRFGDLTWAVLRTIRYTNPSTTGTEKVAMRIKATDQLNGTINQFNCTASQPIPVWNGSAWVSSLTGNNNPAYVYRWILCDCPANPRRVDHSRVDDTALIAWGAECTAKEFTYDCVQDQTSTVFDVLKDVCAAGRASFTVKDGKYSVVRDVAQTVPVQHFSPRNSWGFQGNRGFVDQVHALRAQFVNPQASYQQDEIIVYDDGYSADGAGGTTIATKFETFQLRGCTNANGAWRLARYHLAVARLRPNMYTWNADIEHIVCQRGDLVKLAHDVISAGLAWGRIKSVTTDGSHNVTAVVVDEPLDIAASTTYGIRIRTNDGATHLGNVTATVGLGITALTLVTPVPPVGVTPSVNAGDLFLFGLAGQESIDMIIMKIEPGADLSAKITAVDAAPLVLAADCTENGLIQSAAFDNAAWSKTNLTITPNTITAPDGTLTGDKVAVTATASALMSQVASGIGDADLGALYSIYAQQGSGPTDGADFVLRNDTSATNLLSISVNYSTGAITVNSAATGAVATMVKDANGFWRITLFCPSGIANGDAIRCYGGFTGGTYTAGKFVYLWGADLQRGSSLCKYVPTTTAPVLVPPVFVSNITGAPWNDPPPPPDLVIIASGEVNQPPDDGGINDPGIIVGVGRGPGHIIRPPRPIVRIF